MKTKEIEGTCPCGHKYKSKIKKPSSLTNTITRITCVKCKSKFLLNVFVVKDLFPRKYNFEPQILFLSDMAKRIIQSNMKVTNEAN